MPFKKIGSLKEIAPAIQKKLVLISLLCFAVLVIILGYRMIFSNLKIR
jgi:hypothetical protein